MKSSSTAWSVRSIRAGGSILTFVSVGRLLSVCKRVFCGPLVHRGVIREDRSELFSSGLASFTFYESECSFGRCLLTFFRHSLQVRRPCRSVFGDESSGGWWWSFGPSSADLPSFCCYESASSWLSAPSMSRKNSPAFEYSVTGINFWSCLTPRCLQPACSPTIKCLACLSTLATLLDSALNCGKVSN